MSYIIYTQAGRKCPYCDEAAAMLDERGLQYALRPLQGEELADIAARSRMNTVPIVYFGEELVGGFDRLKERLNRPTPLFKKTPEDEAWERERCEEEARRERAEKLLTEALDAAGIELSWGACGCCDSPWASLKINGETILDNEDSFRFSNMKREEDAA